MRKRLGRLWPQLIELDHLYRAYLRARRGKSSKQAVLRFSLNLEHELVQLQQQLISGAYQPGAYRLFTLYERKPRQIAAAPFRDRVVHHALMMLIEPDIDRRFIDHSFACRKGRGTHYGVDWYQQWAKIILTCYRWTSATTFRRFLVMPLKRN